MSCLSLYGGIADDDFLTMQQQAVVHDGTAKVLYRLSLTNRASKNVGAELQSRRSITFEMM